MGGMEYCKVLTAEMTADSDITQKNLKRKAEIFDECVLTDETRLNYIAMVSKDIGECASKIDRAMSNLARPNNIGNDSNDITRQFALIASAATRAKTLCVMFETMKETGDYDIKEFLSIEMNLLKLNVKKFKQPATIKELEFN